MRLLTGPSHSLADFTEVRSISEQTMSSASQAPFGLREVAREDCIEGPVSHTFSNLPSPNSSLFSIQLSLSVP